LVITDFQAYRNLAFARFFTLVGPKLSEDIPSMINDILATSKGVVLDIGPGAGHQLYRFSHPDQIEIAYGAEPGVDMHAALNENAKKADLGNKYHILACGAEPESLVPALAREGLLFQGSDVGVFDEIISIRVLCGVPNPRETVEGLYRLLKPGGRFVVFEHIVNDPSRGGAWSARIVQQLYMLLGWRLLLGDCHLTRDTMATLRNAARGDDGWASVKLEVVDAWSVIPHVVGYCVKK
jgi:SAM-dependent methyltransferase